MISFGKILTSLGTTFFSTQTEPYVFYCYNGASYDDGIKRTLFLTNHTGIPVNQWYFSLSRGSCQSAYFPFTASYDVCQGQDVCETYEGSIMVESNAGNTLDVISTNFNGKFCLGDISEGNVQELYTPSEDSSCTNDPNRGGKRLDIINGAENSTYVLKSQKTCFYDDNQPIECAMMLPYAHIQPTATKDYGLTLTYEVCVTGDENIDYYENGTPYCKKNASLGEFALVIEDGKSTNMDDYENNTCMVNNHCYEYLDVTFPEDSDKICAPFSSCSSSYWWDFLDRKIQVAIAVSCVIMMILGYCYYSRNKKENNTALPENSFFHNLCQTLHQLCHRDDNRERPSIRESIIAPFWKNNGKAYNEMRPPLTEGTLNQNLISTEETRPQEIQP